MVEFKRYCSDRAKKGKDGVTWTVPIELTEIPTRDWLDKFVEYTSKNKLPYGIALELATSRNEIEFKDTNRAASEQKQAVIDTVANVSKALQDAESA